MSEGAVFFLDHSTPQSSVLFFLISETSQESQTAHIEHTNQARRAGRGVGRQDANIYRPSREQVDVSQAHLPFNLESHNYNKLSVIKWRQQQQHQHQILPTTADLKCQ